MENIFKGINKQLREDGIFCKPKCVVILMEISQLRRDQVIVHILHYMLVSNRAYNIQC